MVPLLLSPHLPSPSSHQSTVASFTVHSGVWVGLGRSFLAAQRPPVSPALSFSPLTSWVSVHKTRPNNGPCVPLLLGVTQWVSGFRIESKPNMGSRWGIWWLPFLLPWLACPLPAPRPPTEPPAATSQPCWALLLSTMGPVSASSGWPALPPLCRARASCPQIHQVSPSFVQMSECWLVAQLYEQGHSREEGSKWTKGPHPGNSKELTENKHASTPPGPRQESSGKSRKEDPLCHLLHHVAYRLLGNT